MLADAVYIQALLRGFMTAVAVTIFAAQLVPILGLDAGLAAEYGPSSTFDEKVRYLVTHLGDAHRLTLLISVAALVVLVSMRVLKKMVASKGGAWRACKYIPQVLLVVVVSTGAYRFHSHLRGGSFADPLKASARQSARTSSGGTTPASLFSGISLPDP